MCLKYLFITVLIYFAYFPKGGNSQRAAEKACDEIISSYEPGLGNYIVNGTKASLGEFPHMVGLAIELPNGTTVYYCGGSLISDTYVLTAAHCVDTFDPDLPITVRAGSLDVGKADFNADTDVIIAERFVHPNYDRTQKYDDVALLRLPEPIKKSANVNAICLETSDANPVGELIVTGWGHTKSKGRRSVKLLKTTVEAVSHKKCKKRYRRFSFALPKGILKEQLCAGDPNRTHRDACQGDSGGPLILPGKDGRSKLVGVTSFGRGCGTRVPGVYARVSSYLDWIEGIVWPN